MPEGEPKMNRHMKEENQAQAEAFRRIQGHELEMIPMYGEDFRQIISDFEFHFGRVPTADELLWVASERNGRDITRN